MLIKYVRDKKGNRVGVVVATGASKVGWSLCNHKDKWDRKKGLMIAEARADLPEAVKVYREFETHIPKVYVDKVNDEGKKEKVEVLQSSYFDMKERSEVYFKA